MRIFISYAAEDSAIAHEVARVCAETGHCPYLYEGTERAGSILTSIHDELRNADRVILIQSKHSDKSKWVFHEIHTAAAYSKIVIPLRTDRSKTPDIVRDSHEVADLESLRRMLRTVSSNCVLVVGGANGETLLSVEGELKFDGKNPVQSTILHGGSGVNYTLRLLSFGLPVFPILPVAKDPIGEEIQKSILDALKGNDLERPIRDFVESDRFFMSELRATPHSSVVVHRNSRTIFKQESNNDHTFVRFLHERIDELDTKGRLPWINAVMIGHIASDRWDTVKGECTKYILRKFESERTFRFVNFGDSQLRHGYSHWINDLQKTDCVQGNLTEFRKLLATPHNPKPSFRDIVEQLLSDEITSLITLDRFGAIGTFKGQKDQVVLAWPFDLADIVDTTGAGDAFGAGIVSNVLPASDTKNRPAWRSIAGYGETVDASRIWAAYACKHLGGASNCPDARELSSFEGSLRRQCVRSHVKTMEVNEVSDFLQIFDRVYS